MRKILVLESVHPDGLNLLKQKFDVEICLGLDRPGYLEKISQAEVIVIKSVVRVDQELIDRGRNLKIVARAGTGIDNIDLNYCRQRGVRVISVPNGNSLSAAEFTIFQILALCRKAVDAARAVGNGDFRRDMYVGSELAGKVVGIVGFGRVGQLVAERLKVFGCRLLALDPREDIQGRLDDLGVERVDELEDLCRRADIITLHAVLNPETRHMITARELGWMKRGVLLVNCARADLIRQQDLVEVLKEKHVAAYATDVLSPEPNYYLEPEKQAYQNPLLGLPNVLITPHMAALTREAQRRIAVTLADELSACFNLAAPAEVL